MTDYQRTTTRNRRVERSLRKPRYAVNTVRTTERAYAPAGRAAPPSRRGS